MNYWDNYFVNVPIGTIYRPKEPVNPLLWFGLSGNASLQRKPSKNECLMCDYVRLAIIHDYELRYSGTPTDIHIISDEYKGKWFERDRFCKDFWAHYRNDNNEKLSQLERAFRRAQADLASKQEQENEQPLITLKDFIKKYCDLSERPDINSKCEMLMREHRKKRIKLPLVKHDYRPGQRKLYYLEELQKNWTAYRMTLTTLPPLKSGDK